MTTPISRRTATRTLAAGALAVLAGGKASAQADAPLVTVNAGFVPVTDVAALYLGEEAGIFRKHGLRLNASMASGSAVPAVMSGEYHFGFTALVNVMQARDKGLPLKMVAAGSGSTGVKGADVTMIHAGPKSGIRSARDLEGKTLSVNALNGLLQLLGKVAIKADGGDPAKARFIELGFAEALAALQAGKIDAMVGAEPFGTAAIAAGFPPIASPYQALSATGLLTSNYFTSEPQLRANPELFRKLRAAIDESLEHAQKNPDALRKQLPKFTRLGPDVAARLILPKFAPGIPRDAIKVFAKAGQQFGMLAKPVVYESVVWDGK